VEPEVSVMKEADHIRGKKTNSYLLLMKRVLLRVYTGERVGGKTVGILLLSTMTSGRKKTDGP